MTDLITSAAIVSAILSKSHIPEQYTEQDVLCLAKNVYFESRGEGVSGQILVVKVTKERSEDPRYPDSICGVVQQSKISYNGHPIKNKCAFSWYCDGKSDKISFYKKNGEINKEKLETFITATTIAIMVLNDDIEEICPGVNFYHNPEKSNPTWAKHYTKVCTIGNHDFYRRELNSEL